jgi:ankyrin repeat protein
LKVVKLLLDAGSNLSAVSALDGTPLHLAVGMGRRHEEMIEMLLNAGSNISARDQAGKTPFVIALENVNTPLAVLQRLLDAGADINEPGLLPLHKTIRKSRKMESHNPQDSESRLQLFIDAKADLTACDNNGLSPLHLAVEILATNMVRILISAGANVSAKDPILGWTPLHCSTRRYWHYPIIGRSDSEQLKHPRPDFREPVGSTDKRLVILALLLKAGADVSIKLSTGETPLHFATQLGDMEIVKVLLDAGADPTV